LLFFSILLFLAWFVLINVRRPALSWPVLSHVFQLSSMSRDTMKLKTTVLATSIAAITFGSVGAAQAGVFASNSIDITNFIWWADLDNSGGPSAGDRALVIDASIPNNGSTPGTGDFTIFQTTDSAGQTVSLNGEIDEANLERPFPLGSLDLAQTCVGPSCVPFTENDFSPSPPPLGLPPVPIVDQYAYADTLLEDAIVEIVNQPDGSPDIDAGATAGLRTDISLNEEAGIASSVADLGNTSSLEIQTQNTLNTYFTLDVVAQSIALVQGGEDAGASARAIQTFSISLEDLVTGGTTSVDLLALLGGGDYNESRVFPNTTPPFSASRSEGSDPLVTGIFTLIGGNRQQLSIENTMVADATKIPAPGTLLLLGAGLAGVGFARRRGAARS
jgi:hypothetical protein